MPTAYTSPFHESDEFDFTDFALRCARYFPATFEQRDEPLSAQIRMPSVDLMSQEVEKAEAELEELRQEIEKVMKLSQEEVDLRVEKENKEILLSNEKARKEQQDIQERLRAALKNVTAWVPPTSNHQALKEFMIEQLESDIEIVSVFADSNQPAKLHSPDTWKDQKIRFLSRFIRLVQNEQEKKQKRAQAASVWLTQLALSLPDGETRVEK